MQQKMRSTVIQLKTSQLITFHKVISYTKFGYNALFIHTPSQPPHQLTYYDVYAFSTSLLHINNLKSHIEQTIKLYTRLNNSKLLSPILQKIQLQDTLYLVSKVERHSLKQLIQRREGLTEYEVAYFIMEVFQILTYCKSREIYFQKLELSNLYLNEDMKLSLPFSMFLNTAGNKPLMKRLPFRNEARNRNVCPELFWGGQSANTKIGGGQNCNGGNKNYTKGGEKDQVEELKTGEQKPANSQQKPARKPSIKSLINIHMVNSWNMGILIYELFENSKPFETACPVPVLSHLSTAESNTHHHELQNHKKFYTLKFYQTQSQQARELITKLLQVDVKKRLNFPLILIEPIFKKIGQVPHILPSTILTCPPSEEFKQSYKQSFPKHNTFLQGANSPNNEQPLPLRPNTRSLKKRNQIIRTQIISRSSSTNHIHLPRPSHQMPLPLPLEQESPAVDPPLFRPNYQTQKYIKASEGSLTENKIYVEQFVDISHVYGFGYQMNTGTLCFVFNDETEFYFPNSNRNFLVYVNEKKVQTFYTYDKLPEEEDLKKKIFILEAYSKSIKKFKTPTQSSSTHQKTITVLRYGRTKHASMFHLSNDSIQVFFNDKICFLTTRTNLYVLSKNTDKYEKYDYRNETNEMKTRREYVAVMANKIFGWKKERGGEEQEEEDSVVGVRRPGMGKKSSLVVEMEGEDEGRLQSLKKIKEKHERNYHMLKKNNPSREKIQHTIIDLE